MKSPKETYDYGECEICDTRLEDRLVRQDFWIHGELIVVENAPAGSLSSVRSQSSQRRNRRANCQADTQQRANRQIPSYFRAIGSLPGNRVRKELTYAASYHRCL